MNSLVYECLKGINITTQGSALWYNAGQRPVVQRRAAPCGTTQGSALWYNAGQRPVV